MKRFKQGIAMLLGAVLTVATCISALPHMGIMAYADGDKTISGLGTGAIVDPTDGNTTGLTGWTGNHVYYGTYGGNSVKYRMLDKEATEFGGTTMLLDCDSTLINKPHDSSTPYSNSWADSEINAWLNGDDFYKNSGVFTSQEKAAIAASSKSDYSNDGQGRDYLDSQNLTGEHVFLLDAKEVTRESYGYASDADKNATRVKSGTNACWWLRSPDPSNAYIAIAGGVNDNGYVDHHDVNYSFDVSPAFNLNLSSVIFSSVISGSAGEAGAEYKLTIADTNLGITPGTVTRSDTTITVPYTITGTNAANATQVSVLITDSAYSAGTAATSGYTYLKLSGGVSGTGTFTLPAAYADKTCGTNYYAYILAEDVNGQYETDYASAPLAITIPNAAKPTLTITAKDITFVYNGLYQGPGDAVYEDPDEIAEMVEVTGLKNGDNLACITIDGQGKEIGEYELTPSQAVLSNGNISDKYDVVYVNGTLRIEAPEKKPTPKPPKKEPEVVSDGGMGQLIKDIKEAAKKGGKQIVYFTNDFHAFSKEVMLLIKDTPNVTVVYTFYHEGNKYIVSISADQMGTDFFKDEDIWYGPLNLKDRFRNISSKAADKNAVSQNLRYVIKRGDTLSRIARENETTVSELARINNIKDINFIITGQTLMIK